MGRYYNRFITNLPVEQISTVIDGFFAANRFKPYSYKGETWMKCGKGILMAPQIMRVCVDGNLITVEAFVRYSILPGVYLGEFELDESFVLCVPKSELKSKVRNLEFQLGFNPAFQYQTANNTVGSRLTADDDQCNHCNGMNHLSYNNQPQSEICPKCNNASKAESAFCMYCGNKF